MMKFNLLSIFMAFLLICLPIYTADVMATATGNVHNISVKGEKAGMEGFVEETDALEVIAEVSKSDDGETVEVGAGSLSIDIEDGEDGFHFEDCDEEGDRYKCNYAGDVRDWTADIHNVEVTLYDDELLQPLDDDNKDFYVNELEPEILEFDVPSTATGGPMSIEYSVQDRACEGCGNVCVGLDKVELLNQEDETLYSEEGLSGCSHSDVLNISAEELGLEIGEDELCLKVHDKGGLSSKQCESILIDYYEPQYVSSNLTDEEGHEIEYISTKIMEGNLNLQVIEEVSTIKEDNVEADLTELYPDAGENVESPDECTEEEDVYTCKWEDIGIYGVSDETADVQIEASDELGNTMERNLYFDLPIDDSEPTVESIYTPNDNYLNASRNTIVMEINEPYSGMSDGEAYLNLVQVSPEYGSSERADYCELEGNWKCYWEDIQAGEGVIHGQEVSVWVDEVRDAAGNVFTEEIEEIFTYDGKEPEILNVSITPMDEGYETIPVDVGAVEIEAFIEDNVSGVSHGNVYANYDDIAEGEGWSSADACTEENETVYLCRWEYTKDNLVPEEWIELDLKLSDDAGNKVVEEDAGKAFVSDVVDAEPNYWEDEASGRAGSDLNPNHLWMASDGTLIRATVRLVPQGEDIPYVHRMLIDECQGKLTNDVDDSFTPYEIQTQGYVDDDRQAKYLILDVPNYEKENVPDGGTIEIACGGRVLQSRSEHGQIYNIDERFNSTIEVDLMDGLYQEPGSETVNRLHESSDFIDTLDEIINYIDKASIVRTLCTGFQTVREIINGLCMIWEGTVGAVTGPSSTCERVVGLMERLWYGTSELDDRGVGDGLWVSTKDDWSVGFICDFFLCTDCSKQWNYAFSEWLDTDRHRDLFGLGGGEYSFYLGETPLIFNPHRSLPVAVLCWPPCLTGIQNNLLIWKQIEVNYNVCLNIQAVRGGDTSVCSEYRSSQWCQEVLAQLWEFIEGGLAHFVATTIAGNLEAVFGREVEIIEQCRGMSTAEMVASECSPFIVYEVLGWFVTIEELWRNIESLWELTETFKDQIEMQDEVEAEMEEEFDEGETPYELTSEEGDSHQDYGVATILN